MLKSAMMKILLLATLLCISTAFADQTSIPAEVYEHDQLSKVLYFSRQLLTREPVRKLLWETFGEEMAKKYPAAVKTKEISESQFVLLLREFPEMWPLIEEYLKAVPEVDPENKKQEAIRQKFKERFEKMVIKQNVLEQFAALYEPYNPLDLVKEGEIAYKSGETEIYFNHPIYDGRKTISPVDLGQTSEIRLRPEVRAIFERLRAKGVYIHPTQMSALNHQKVIAINVDLPNQGEVLFSSGNFTQSCLGPEGDLKDVPPNLRPKDSIPNANHFVIFKSPILATVTAHELIKRLHPNYELAGRDLPLGGSYRIYGEYDSKIKKHNMVIATFSPKGALGDINNDVIKNVIDQTKGPLRFGQFVMSSKVILEAIVNRIARDLKETGNFSFQGIGDGPFALREYSVFVALAGLKKEGDKYVEDPDALIRKVLSQEQIEELRKHIRVAPEEYGENTFKSKSKNGEVESVKYGAKYHHKVMIAGLAAILGTSFNFSDNAKKNNETLLVIRDMKLWKAASGALTYAYHKAKGTVYDLAMKRNRWASKTKETDSRRTERVRQASPSSIGSCRQFFLKTGSY